MGSELITCVIGWGFAAAIWMMVIAFTVILFACIRDMFKPKRR